MNLPMNDKTIQLLHEIATKLGSTADHVFAVMIRQAYINALIDVFQTALILAVFVFWYRLVKRKTSKRADPSGGFDRPEWDDGGDILAWVSVYIFGIIIAFILGNVIDDLGTSLLNPEYWALHQLIK